MADFIGEKIGPSVDEAICRLVNAQHFRAGSIVSMPVTYPSGATVVLEVTAQRGRCFVSDRGGGHQESELYGATRYFKSEASAVANRAGIRFDGRDMFVAEIDKESLHGAMVVVANASAEAANLAAVKMAERSDRDARDDLFLRLRGIFKSKSVDKDAEVKGQSSHKWRISVVVADQIKRAFFEPVSGHYISVVGTAAKFHDFVRVQNPPSRFAVVKSREEMGDYFGVISAASTKVINMAAPDNEFLGLLEAA